MALQTEDRRSTRTREALLQAFLKALFARGYEALTVGDVAAEANIGRSTFYEHFNGKDDLLAYSFRMPFGVLADIVGVEAVSERTLRLLAHFRERRKLGPAVFAPAMRPLLSRTLTPMIEARLPDGKTIAPRRLIALEIAEAQLALVDAWIMARVACSIEAMAATLHASTNAIVRAMYLANQDCRRG